MNIRNLRHRFDNEGGTLKMRVFFSQVSELKKRSFFRKHPYASFIAMGLAAAVVYFFPPKLDIEIDYSKKNFDLEEMQKLIISKTAEKNFLSNLYFPFEDERISESQPEAKNLTLNPIGLENIIIDVLDPEKESLEEYSEQERRILAKKYGIANEDAYSDIIEGREDIDIRDLE